MSPTRDRLTSLDLLRGVVMVLMALDHVRDFIAPGVAPEMLEDPGVPLFLTRWVTHFCAPTFVFLAGISAFLYGARRSRGALAWFLLSRGAWLILLEMTIIYVAWTFVPPFTNVMFLQVIFVIGASMMALAGLVWLPRGLLVGLCAAAIVGHDALATTSFETAKNSPATGWKIRSSREAPPGTSGS